MKLGNNFTRLTLGKFLRFGQNASEIIPSFQEYTIWLPIITDYLLETNYVSNRGFLACLSWIVLIENSTSQMFRELILGLHWEFSEVFDKIPVWILLDVFFRVLRFSKTSINALTSSIITFLNFVTILALGLMEGFHGNFVISRVKL